MTRALRWAALAVPPLVGIATYYSILANERAQYWGSILSSDLKKAGASELQSVRALPLKGCGWSFGETAWGWTVMAGARTRVLMCRNRSGVRLDVTTYESRWIRGAGQ